MQPGAFDGGILPDIYGYSPDSIGTLSRFVWIDFNGGDNEVDAAIALSRIDLLGNATPSNGYGTPKSTTKTASIKMAVQKYGRTTGLTSGKIYAMNATVNVGYDVGTAKFVGQLIISPGTFSAGGDSGSLIVTKSRTASENNKPVGLLFAGSNLYTIANPIDAVLDFFDVTIDGE